MKTWLSWQQFWVVWRQFVGAALVVVAAGCASTGSAPTAVAPTAVAPTASGKPVLRVGITTDLPPMVFRQSGQLTGVEIELAKLLAESLGREVKFVEVPWEGQIEALLAGKTDVIMSGMTVTRARAMRIDFSEPYLRAGQNVLVRRTEATKVQMLLGVQAMKVGVQKGTVSDFFVQQNLPKAERVLVKSPKAAAEALLKNKIEAYVSDATINWWLAAEYEAQGLTVLPQLLNEEYLAWGFRKEDTALRASANAFVKAVSNDGRLAAIARRWMPFAQ